MHPNPIRQREPQKAQLIDISRREREILRLIAAGLTNTEIADRLFVSVNTVKTHVKHIFSKLDVESRAQAVACAISQGWL